jgi:hypothetical protein
VGTLAFGPAIGIGPGLGLGIFTFVILNGRAGTRSAALADEAARQEALRFAAPAHGVALYLIRNTGMFGWAVGLNISVDGQERAQLVTPRFARLEVGPGRHAVHAAFAGVGGGHARPAELEFEAPAGSVVVLRFGLAQGLLRNKLRIERVPPETVTTELAQIPMVVADTARAAANGK